MSVIQALRSSLCFSVSVWFPRKRRKMVKNVWILCFVLSWFLKSEKVCLTEQLTAGFSVMFCCLVFRPENFCLFSFPAVSGRPNGGLMKLSGFGLIYKWWRFYWADSVEIWPCMFLNFFIVVENFSPVLILWIEDVRIYLIMLGF